MIKTIPLDIWISFVLGLVFALSAAPMLEKEESMINTYFIRGLLFQVVIFFPIGLFLGKNWTAWTWMYLIDPQAHSRYWTLMLVLSYIPAMIAGFHIAYLCIRSGKKEQVYWYLVSGIFVITLITFGMFGRLFHISDMYIPVPKVLSSPTWFGSGWFLLSMMVITVVFCGGVYYVLKLNAADRQRMARESFSSPVSS